MEYEDRLTISTPEGIELDLTLAGIGSRCMAALIDFTLQSLLIATPIVAIAGISALDSSPAGVEAGDGIGDGVIAAVISVYVFLIIFAYDVLFEVRGGGRTPGKRLCGLRVLQLSGRPVGFLTSAIRNVLRIVDILPFGYGVALASVFGTRRNQRLGDLAAGTVVVRERTGGRMGRRARRRASQESAEDEPPLTADGWDASAVTGEDIATVRRFLQRRHGLREDARAQLAGQLATRLRPKVSGVPDGTGDEAFLATLSAAKAARATP